MDGRRVVVTGIGVVAPCGIGVDAFFEGLCGPAPVGERRVDDFDPAAFFDNPKEARRADRFTQFAVAAAAEALAQAGEVTADPTRRGTFIGTGVGGIQTLEEQIGNRIAATDLRYDGYRIAAGTRVVYSIYLTHRHKAHWPDRERFDPERFGPQAGHKPPPYAYLPFGGGPSFAPPHGVRSSGHVSTG